MQLPIMEGTIIELGTACSPNLLTKYHVLKTFDLTEEAQKLGIDLNARLESNEQQKEKLQKLEVSLLSQKLITPLQVH